jgi:hypothetical protein
MVKLAPDREGLNYKILNDIRCQAPAIEEAIFDWRKNTDLQGFTVFNNLVDVSTLNGEFQAVAFTSGAETYIEQPFAATGVTPSLNRIEIALRVLSTRASKAKIQFIKQSNEDTDPSVLDSLGQFIEFDIIQDGNYHVYSLDPSQLASWQGLVTRFRLFPGDVLLSSDIVSLQFIRILTFEEDSLCRCEEEDFFENVPSPCTGAGRGAAVQGVPVTQGILVSSNNNVLDIEIDGARRQVELSLQVLPTNPKIVAFDIQTKLNKLGFGGFRNATCEFLGDRTFRIQSGFRGVETSIKLFNTSRTILKTIGMFNVFGAPSFLSFSGVSDSLTPEGLDSSQYLLPNSSLNVIKDPSLRTSVPFDSSVRMVEIGNPFFDEGSLITPFNASGLTLIDYLRPATNSGVINELFFNGTVLLSPQTKIKIFRPTNTNGLEFIDEVTVQPNEILSGAKINAPVIPPNQERRLFRVETELEIRYGDVLGLSNAVVYTRPSIDYITRALTDSEASSVLNLSCLLGKGDITTLIKDVDSLDSVGEGLNPLPIFGHSTSFRKKSSVFIDLGERKGVDKIAFQYNVLQAFRNTASVSSQVTTVQVNTFGSTHTHWRYIVSGLGLEQTSVTQTTNVFNTNLLFDGNTKAFNGDDSQYFYLDGDGDLDNTDFTSPGLIQPQTFIDDRFDIEVTLSPNFEKNISTINLYFVEPINWIFYGIFYVKGGTRVPFDFTGVLFDDSPMPLDSIFFTNPLDPNDVSLNQETRTAVLAQAGVSAHRKLTFHVKPRKANKIVFEVYKHFSTKMTEIEVLTNELVTSTGFEVRGQDIFKVSVADDDLRFENVIFDADKPVQAQNVFATSITVGKPVRYIRAEIEPPVPLELYNIQVLPEKKDDFDSLTSDKSFFTSTTEGSVVFINYDEPKFLDFENKTGSEADLILDIIPDASENRRLPVLWSRLNSEDDLNSPDIGPPALYAFDEDYEVRIRYDVAQNNASFGTFSLSSVHGQSGWAPLDTALTDGGSANNISIPIAGTFTDPLGGNSLYEGEVDSGGSWVETFDISYTVVIDISNGALPGLGSGFVPTFTVISDPPVDDIVTPTEILDFGVFYPVGTNGILMRWNDVSPFGEDDVFTVSAVAPIIGLNTSISAKDFGYAAVRLGEFFFVESIELDIAAEKLSQTLFANWKQSDGLFALSKSDNNNITGVQFGSFGNINTLGKWVLVSWDFTQPSRGGFLNNIRVYVNEPIFSSKEWWVSSLPTDGFISTDTVDFSPDNKKLTSIKFNYLANKSTEVVFSLDESGEIGPDSLWSFRDFVFFKMKHDNPALIDSLKVRVGSNSSNYYEWELSLDVLDVGEWIDVQLRFTEALIFGSPELYDSLSYVAFVVKGNNGASNFSFNTDTFKVKRNKFEDSFKFNKSLYLSNNEFVRFYPVDGLTLREGTVEFWLKPDFNSLGLYEHEEFLSEQDEFLRQYKYYIDERELTHTLLTLISGFDFRGTLAVRSNLNGLIFQTNNAGGDTGGFVSRINFEWDDIMHIALTWKHDVFVQNTHFRVYVNGELYEILNTPWAASVEDNMNLIIGGKADSDIFIITPTSCDAFVDNVKAYNFYKDNFNDRDQERLSDDILVKNNDMIAISVNDGGFSRYGEPSLPLLVKAVPPGGKVKIGVRFIDQNRKIPTTLNRKARIEAKWRVR